MHKQQKKRKSPVKSQPAKNDDVVSAVIEAAGRKGINSFVLAFFHDDGGVKLSTVRMNEMRPIDAASLGLIVIEQACEILKQNSPNAPLEFRNAIDRFLASIGNASLELNNEIKDLHGSIPA